MHATADFNLCQCLQHPVASPQRSALYPITALLLPLLLTSFLIMTYGNKRPRKLLLLLSKTIIIMLQQQAKILLPAVPVLAA